MRFNDWLLLLFIYLKLTNQIDWSWNEVLIPFYLLMIVLFYKSVKKVHKKKQDE